MGYNRDDLIYLIRKIAELEMKYDSEIEDRIDIGINDLEVMDELIQFSNDISNEVGIEFLNISDMGMYPLLVEEKLEEYIFYKDRHMDVKKKILK